MQIADFLTEVPTPGPLLRTLSDCRTMPVIGGADHRRGVETLVTAGRQAHCVCPDLAARLPPSRPLVLDHYATPASRGESGVSMRRKRSAATSGVGGLDETFRSLSPWLTRKLAHRLGPGRSDIDDLVQESFVRLGRYAPDDRNRHPRALLWRIAGNVARDAFRREAARHRNAHMPFDEAALGSLAAPPDQHAHVALKRAILTLPEPLRDVFLLARFTPMTNADIARHLDISVKTVEWRLARATALCLEQLSE